MEKARKSEGEPTAVMKKNWGKYNTIQIGLARICEEKKYLDRSRTFVPYGK